jgi:hypothetical protein
MFTTTATLILLGFLSFAAVGAGSTGNGGTNCKHAVNADNPVCGPGGKPH